MTKRRRPLSTGARRERSAVCRSWTDTYGKRYRDLATCARWLPKTLRNARNPGDLASAMFFCGQAFEAARKNMMAMEVIGRCVRRGFSHGVLQPRK